MNELYVPESSSLVHSDTGVRIQPDRGAGGAMDSISGPNNASNNTNLASKQWLRWTQELHERFFDDVAQPGGPNRTGIAELIALKMSKQIKVPLEETCKRIWLVDSKSVFNT